MYDSYTPSYTTEDTDYPGDNTQDTRLTKVWRTTSVAAAQYATIDSGAGNTLEPTCAFVFATNVTSSGTISIQGSDDNFSSTDEDVELTRITEDIYAKFFTPSAARRYWRIEVDDSTNTDLYAEIGRIWFGTYIDITLAAANNFQEHPQDSTKSIKSMSGQSYSDIGNQSKNYQFNFPWWAYSNKDIMNTFWETVLTAKKFVFIFDESDMTKIKPLYCKLDQPIQYNHRYNLAYNGVLRVTEEL